MMNRNIINPISIQEALQRSCYPKMNHDFLKDFLIKQFSENNLTKVYLTEIGNSKYIFVIEYSLKIPLGNAEYPLKMLLYIPELFPDYQPEFYISSKLGPSIGINQYYLNGKINPSTLKLNIDLFKSFDPVKNNVEEIAQIIISSFHNKFPIYKANYPQNFVGPCCLDTNFATPIIIKKEQFTDEDVLKKIREQTKNIVSLKYEENKKSFSFNENLKKLDNINSTIKSKMNGLSVVGGGVEKEIASLEKIKGQLIQMEEALSKEIEDIKGKSNGDVMEKYKDCYRIENEEDFKLAVMKKTIDDYLKFIKKGYEKKIIDFQECLKKTRQLSLELFQINYMIKRNKSNSYI